MEAVAVVTPLSRWKAVLSYIIVAMFLFFEMGVQVSPSVMTSYLMRDLSLGAFGLGLMSGFYFYSYTLMQIPSGILFDKFRPRYVISTAIIVCSLGCLFFGMATNIYLGSLARVLMGFGSAFAFVAVLVVTADLFPSKYFAFITGITQTLAALGAMSGQMPLSFAVSNLGWRNTMFILALVGVILAVIVWMILNYKKDLFAHTGETKQAPAKSSGHIRNIIYNKQTWLVALYALLLWAPMSGFASLWGVPFLEHVYGLSKSTAALVCSMMWLGLAFASPLVGWASTANQSRVKPLALSALIGALAFAGILFFKFDSLVWLAILVFISGGACAGQALSFTVVKENNTARQRATAIAFNNMAVVISGAIFQPVLGKLLDFHCSTASASLASCEAHHYKMSMLLVLAVYALAFVVAQFFIKESFGKGE